MRVVTPIKINGGKLRVKFIGNYNPPCAYRRIARYVNGYTFRLGRFALHVWWV